MLPTIVWLDDDLARDGPPSFGLAQATLSDSDVVGRDFDVRFFHDTDEAISFTQQNARRIFLFIQDSSRWKSSAIENWRTTRQNNLPRLGLNSLAGDFYTYVIDAFAPNAGSIFAGYGFTTAEQDFITQWGAFDDRISFEDKYALLRSSTAFGKKHLQRWFEKRSGVSAEVQFFDKVVEEMIVLCAENRSHLRNLSPRQFEMLIASLFKNHGFDVGLTASTKDGGYDVVLVDHSSLARPVLVECKHFGPGRPVGVGVVRALYGVKVLNSASKVLLATSSYVSNDAKREFARVIPWELDIIEQDKIIEMCKSSVPAILQRQLSRTSEA